MVCTKFGMVLLHLVLYEEARMKIIVNIITVVLFCEATTVSLHLRCFVIVISIINRHINAGWYGVKYCSQQYRTQRN